VEGMATQQLPHCVAQIASGWGNRLLTEGAVDVWHHRRETTLKDGRGAIALLELVNQAIRKN